MTVLEIPTPDPRTLDEASRPFALAVADRYAIKKLIGRGGMGMVFLARDRRLDRLVAIKTLPPQVAEDESVRQRFLRETRMAGALSHPNIVPVHGADEVDGHAFFVMAFIDGDSLAARLRAEGRLEPRAAARILRDVAAALGHAHERGIIHRDVKAENILLERTGGRAMVTDFGVARLAEAAPLTATGQVLGTVYYTSPEQVAGDRIDARSDLYSLGVVGFLALTGTFPFDGELASAVLIAHVNKTPPKVRSLRPEVPESLAAIVDRCLSKDPAGRYANAAALCDALDVVLREPASPVRPMGSSISDTQAQAVWQRAAELQASEPVQSGLALDRVREAGREAGIQTRFLDRALAERESRTTVGRGRWWAGVPLDIELGAEVEREVAPADFDRLLTILRVGTGQPGTTTAAKREIAWRGAGLGYWLDVSIVPADGKTSIALKQSVRRMVTAALVGGVYLGGVVGWLTTLLMQEVVRRPTHVWVREVGVRLDVSRPTAEWIAVGIGLVAGLSVLPLTRLLIKRLYRTALKRVAAIRDALVANVR
jgi:predicted Ser/Thr protein kinase